MFVGRHRTHLRAVTSTLITPRGETEGRGEGGAEGSGEGNGKGSAEGMEKEAQK